jgi:L-2-hydroxyglutarate oxidase
MYEIYKQGVENGVDLQLMSREQAQKREPLLRGYGQDVIWSPTTSVANQKQLISKISSELISKPTCSQFYDLEILKIDRTLKGDQIEVATENYLFESRYLINCAGQHALDIAEKFGQGLDYKMLPVKGNYLISDV